MKKRELLLPGLVYVLVLSCGVRADYFDDQGNDFGRFRTD